MGLLSLPKELRQQIYEDVLCTTLHRPQNPDQAGPRLEEWIFKVQNGMWRFFHEPDLCPQAACQGLLRCNRQIRVELEHILAKAKNLTYELDIMIENTKNGDSKHRAWPTWTVFPAPVKYMRNLNVHLRVFGRHDIDSAWPGAYSFIYAPLFISLSRILHHGPQFIYRGPFKSKLHIDSLTVDLWNEMYPLNAEGIVPLTREAMPFSRVYSAISELASTGILTGKVSRIRVCTGESIKEIEPQLLEREERSYAPQVVQRLSFIWGVEPSSDVATDVL